MKNITEFFKAVAFVSRHGSSTVLRDPLTELYSRRFFYGLVRKEIAQTRRHQRPLTIAFFDVDKLKQINDERGHNEGDRVLKKVGRAILNNCRQSDVPVRWGGDEFLLPLPETDLAKTKNVAERILAEVGDIGLSYGLASWEEGFSSLDDFVAQADQRMYAAKEAKWQNYFKLPKITAVQPSKI